VTFYRDWIEPEVERDPEVIKARLRLEKAERERLDAAQAYQNALSKAIADWQARHG
jgi:hypothetical protein